jgi:alkylation response protein AidB-like acyl-CoA dehydrogenase
MSRLSALAGPAGHQAHEPGHGDPPWRQAARAFTSAVDSGQLDLPLPGGGRTRQRWAAFADLAGQDLSLVRLAEGHADAVAILAELGEAEIPPGSRWGVWAANPPGPSLEATRTGPGWRLQGVKQYCSGARACTHALVTAAADDGMRLFTVATDALVPRLDTWPATGMAGSDTLDVAFDGIPATPAGPPGAYVSRPGFAHGGAGVAACWYGGARAVGRTLLSAATKRDIGPHALAHLGAVDLALGTARAALDQAAADIDADPDDRDHTGWRRALQVRTLVESVATEVMDRVGRALGAGPLSHDEAHGRLVADLTVYLRQHHAERDLAALGELAAEQGARW